MPAGDRTNRSVQDDSFKTAEALLIAAFPTVNKNRWGAESQRERSASVLQRGVGKEEKVVRPGFQTQEFSADCRSSSRASVPATNIPDSQDTSNRQSSELQSECVVPIFDLALLLRLIVLVTFGERKLQ